MSTTSNKESKEQIVMVQLMKPTITVSTFGINKELPCSDIADGCVGISLWFESEESAKKWGGEDVEFQHATASSRKGKS